MLFACSFGPMIGVYCDDNDDSDDSYSDVKTVLVTKQLLLMSQNPNHNKI